MKEKGKSYALSHSYSSYDNITVVYGTTRHHLVNTYSSESSVCTEFLFLSDRDAIDIDTNARCRLWRERAALQCAAVFASSSVSNARRVIAVLKSLHRENTVTALYSHE